ncbi:3-dehydroquinate synthase [Enterococcus sp. AZ103]|uniref:3-dehydroquinate synthase n=1 Tax=Enterococcus sp. AZ103 TaxID=2774628 RepID=UPI003F223C77
MLKIELGSKSYDILLEEDALKKLGAWVAEKWSARKIALISDSNVFPIYGAAVLADLKKHGFEVVHYIIPAGEKSKSLETANQLYDFLTENDFSRSDALIGLGGGVIGDLTGFVASTYMRGLHFIQVPTSLLAQVDSSIGGKTGVNSQKAKNIIGTFAQPDGVLIDPTTLKTLPQNRLAEGMAEVIKCALIQDKNLWQQLRSLSGLNEVLPNSVSIIEKALLVKKKLVEADEFDESERLLLNFGHTIGHGLEASQHYENITHGEAVAIGMVQMTKAAEEKGLSQAGLAEEISQMVKKYQLPASFTPWQSKKIYQAILHDKKVRGKNIQIVIVPEIGKGEIHKILLSDFQSYL